MLLLLFSLSFLSYPMDCSMPGLPVHHQIPDFAQTNFHWVTDAIQLSQTLSSTSLPAFNLSQNWGHFQRVGSSHQGTKASSSVLSMNIQGWFLWELTDLISLQSKVLSRFFSKTTVQKHLFFGAQSFLLSTSHIHTTRKTIALTRWTLLGKVVSLLFNMLSRFDIAFLPRSKCLLISRLQSPSEVILEPRKIKSVTVSLVSPSIFHEAMGQDAMILVFLMLSFKPSFSFSSFTFIKRLFSFSLLSAIKVVPSAYLRLLIFLLAILIPACASSSWAFVMMYFACKLNKQDDNIEPWYIPFSILNQSVIPNRVLTIASWPAYRFLRRQVRWSGIPITLRAFHSLLWSTQSKALSQLMKQR